MYIDKLLLKTVGISNEADLIVWKSIEKISKIDVSDVIRTM